MKKYKFFINYDKEEKWLNEMAKRGYELQDARCGYKFRLGEPQNTIIKIDYRVFKSRRDYIDYCTLFEDSGWKHVSGSKNSGAQYFRRVDENSEEDIFSDEISRAGRYKRISEMWMSLAISFLPLIIVLINTNAIKFSAMLNPKQLYYTPGLWQRTGLSFWGGFLFETPFAIMRGYSWTLLAIMVILYFIFSIKAKMLYDKQKNL